MNIKDVRDGVQTIENVLNGLIGKRSPLELLLWPPDLFAFTSQILRANAAYQLVVSPPVGENWPPSINAIRSRLYEIHETCTGENGKYRNMLQRNAKNTSLKEYLSTDLEWKKFVEKCGKDWEDSLKSFNITKFLEELAPSCSSYEEKLINQIIDITPLPLICFWESFFRWAVTRESIRRLRTDSSNENSNQKQVWIAVSDLLSLHAIADEACWGWGLKKTSRNKAKECASAFLYDKGTMSTIDVEICRVLPKRHNPTTGITLRSLSSNLGFQTSSVDVDINWQHSGHSPLDNKAREENFNSFTVLLLPWPLRVYARDFRPYKFPENTEPLPNNINFFTYDPDSTDMEKAYRYGEDEVGNPVFEDLRYRIRKNLPKVLDKAMDEVGNKKIDMVIFPESALNEEILTDVEKILSEKEVSVYIAGVRDKPKDMTVRFERNSVYFKTLQKNGSNWEFPLNQANKGDNSRRYRQSKHHRWKLTYSQIIKYNLGISLNPNKDWWEAIKINRRKVSFINIGDKLTICPLICEDLARQDPIASVIRTVGPSLVVTILMDGPQTMNRWAARYASVLADDPGSSVLTLTSYGMVRRSNQASKSISNVVALFYDGLSSPQELEFDNGAAGILLNLCLEEKREFTLDGRSERKKTQIIKFGGAKQVRLRKKDVE